MMRVVGNGRVANTPEIKRYEDSGRKIATFSLAVRKKFPKEDGPTADFFRCVAFGEKVEFINDYIRKGMMIVIDGRLDTSIYENDEGQEVRKTQIIIEEIEFGESKKSYESRMAEEETVEEKKEVKRPVTKKTKTKEPEPKSSSSEEISTDEIFDDLPF